MPALLIFFQATIILKHQNIIFLKNCLSIISPLGYNSSGEFLWETYKLSNKKYECFFGGNQFFQLLLLIAKNPAGKKEEKLVPLLKKHFPILTPIMYQKKCKKSFIFVGLSKKVAFAVAIFATLLGGKIVMA